MDLQERCNKYGDLEIMHTIVQGTDGISEEARENEKNDPGKSRRVNTVQK